MPLTENVTIAVDAMGGDNAPSVVLDGVAAALAEDENLQVVLVGPADVVEPFASTHNRCTAAVATEVIGMAEHPAEAVRKKKDSSIVIGCKLVKEGKRKASFPLVLQAHAWRVPRSALAASKAFLAPACAA